MSPLFPIKGKIAFFFFMLCLFISTPMILSEEIKIFNYNGKIEFAKIQEFQINFKDYQKDTPKFYFEHSFLSIRANVTTESDCSKKSCSQPIRIYGKINDKPRPEDVYFDKKDDNGKFTGNSVLYGFEYSPCQLSLNDTLNIGLVGIEGKSNFTLTVSFNYLDNYKVLCTDKELNKNKVKVSEPRNSLYPGRIHTSMGVIQWGGKLNETEIDDKMYLLNLENENKLYWQIINIPSQKDSKNFEIKPEPRYGHFMTHFENYLIVFGGKNKNEEILNDLWVLDFTDKSNPKWINIDYSTSPSKNIPSAKYIASGGLIRNHGLVLIFGGKNNFDDKNIYLLDLKILSQLIEFKLNLSKESSEEYSKKIPHLWKIISIKELVPRYGLSITQIKNDEVMFFGGFDRSDYSLSRLEILNLSNFSVKIIEPKIPSEFPYARGFHSMAKYGSILVLYGGKIGTGENLNDMWKFIVENYKWVKVNEGPYKEQEFHLFKSDFLFTKLENSERPVIFGGENWNKESSNVIILMDFEICTSDTKILSDYPCIPCSEGYMLNDQKKCVGCSPGDYLEIDNKFYTESKCSRCPAGKYNPFAYSQGISACKLCPYDFYNNEAGQRECLKCNRGLLPDEVCLPGTTKPKKDDFLLSKVNQDYQQDINFPDFLNTNTKIKTISRTSALIVVSIITSTMLIILLICYKLRKRRVTKFLIYMDFIPLTGGSTKKCSGGLITLIYTILIISLAFSFVMRYVYFNELIEVIPLAYSNSEQDSLKSSIRFNVEIVGDGFMCINPNEAIGDGTFKCSRDLEISKIRKNSGSENLVISRDLTCSLTPEKYCKVSYHCEDCKSMENNDLLQIEIKNNNSFVQLFHWNFESVWADNFDYNKGYSINDGIFKADENIK
jgi:hypothetical protein